MSDDGLDAELLALAGGEGSSSEEEDNVPIVASKKTKPAPKPRNGTTSRKSKKNESDEDERSPDESENESPVSRARSRSDASATSVADDTPLYPLEGKFRSETDRKEILAMTEIEREEILADRAAETQRRAQDKQLKKLLSAQRNGIDDGKKRKAGAADLEDSGRKSSRQKTKVSENLEAYKRQRELKGAQRAKGEEDRKRGIRSASAEREDDDYDERSVRQDSEVEWADERRSSPKKDEPPPELRDFERTRTGRSNFAKVCFYPNFENAIRGCHCRVNVGMDAGPKYKMGSIKDFREGRPYFFEANNKKLYTNQYVVVALGKKETQLPLSACSDSKFTDFEFSEYRKQLLQDNLRLPSRRQLNDKTKDITALIEHQFTDYDIQSKLDKADDMRKAYFNLMRERLERRRNEAQSRGDEATVARCNRELGEFDSSTTSGKLHAPIGSSQNLSSLQNNSGLGSTPKKETQQSKLAALNKANRKTNTEEIRKALVAEKLAIQKSRAAFAAAKAAKIKEEEELVKASQESNLKKEGQDDDLFGDDGVDAELGAEVKREITPLSQNIKVEDDKNGVHVLKEKKSFGQFLKRKTDDEVIGSLDLDIDIDI